jgi:hypothetical protein
MTSRPTTETGSPGSTEIGQERFARARRAYGQAVVWTELAPDQAEERGREALRLCASALNWLEDTEHEDRVHEELESMGRYMREHLPKGCRLHWTGDRYEHRCPVAIAHKRFGFSPALREGRRICSICGEDVSECEHLPDSKYPAPGGVGPSGYCPVCIRKDCSDHSPDATFVVYPVSIVEEIIGIDHVAVVRRPKQPDARLTAIPIDTKRLRKTLGPNFQPGMELNCDRCLLPCQGFDYPSTLTESKMAQP